MHNFKYFDKCLIQWNILLILEFYNFYVFFVVPPYFRRRWLFPVWPMLLRAVKVSGKMSQNLKMISISSNKIVKLKLKKKWEFRLYGHLTTISSTNETLALQHYPPASKASREVTNLTWRKNPYTLTFIDYIGPKKITEISSLSVK